MSDLDDRATEAWLQYAENQRDQIVADEVVAARQPEQVEHLDLTRILIEEVTRLDEWSSPASLATRLLMRGDIRITYTAQEG